MEGGRNQPHKARLHQENPNLHGMVILERGNSKQIFFVPLKSLQLVYNRKKLFFH